jgi:NAD(P) transhydrogenase subunit alpha
MDPETIRRTAEDLTRQAQALLGRAETLLAQSRLMEAAPAGTGAHADFFLTGLTVFALACFVGYYVVWRVTPALHSPLMAVTNAISSVIIVGALIAAGPATFSFASLMGFLAVTLASVNIFGGFIVTRRMLAMYRRKAK